MGKDKASEKEIFALWWEYLKESGGYKKWLKNDLKEYKDFLNQVKNHRPSDPPIHRMTGDPKWEALFHRFGDIHNNSFESWWERRINRRNTNPHFKEIDDYSNSVGIDILQCFTNIKEKATDREMFEEQFRSAFVNRMKSSPLLHLEVDVNADLEYLTKEFRKIVLKHRKEKESKLWQHRIHQYPSVTRARLKEIRECLNTFREKRLHKNWKKTMYALNPAYEHEKEDNIRNRYYTHLKIAKKLIENAENGNFPGNYS